MVNEVVQTRLFQQEHPRRLAPPVIIAIIQDPPVMAHRRIVPGEERLWRKRAENLKQIYEPASLSEKRTMTRHLADGLTGTQSVQFIEFLWDYKTIFSDETANEIMQTISDQVFSEPGLKTAAFAYAILRTDPAIKTAWGDWLFDRIHSYQSQTLAESIMPMEPIHQMYVLEMTLQRLQTADTKVDPDVEAFCLEFYRNAYELTDQEYTKFVRSMSETPIVMQQFWAPYFLKHYHAESDQEKGNAAAVLAKRLPHTAQVKMAEGLWTYAQGTKGTGYKKDIHQLFTDLNIAWEKALASAKPDDVLKMKHDISIAKKLIYTSHIFSHKLRQKFAPVHVDGDDEE